MRERGGEGARRGLRLVTWAMGLLCVALLSARTARANGRFPATNHFVVRPGHPNDLVLRATFGLLLSKDGGASWHWLCERGVGFSGAQDPPVVFTERGTLLLALFEGLAVSHKGGCDFALAGGALARQVAVDATALPGEPDGALVLTGSYAGSDGGAARYRSALFVTRDGGRTFEALGKPLDPTLLVETVEIARSDPRRVYISAIRDGQGGPKGVLLVSDDGGRSFRERAVALEGEERAPFIAAVDPQQKERVYLRTSGQGEKRVLVTDDGGKTFRAVHRTRKGPAFALSPDGATVYVGGGPKGLLAASRESLAFEPRALFEVQCLFAEGEAVYACSNEANGFLLGKSVDGGRTFRPLLRFAGIGGVLPCAADDQGSLYGLCAAEWPVLRQELALDTPAPAASAADGGGAASAPVAAPRRCACHAAGAGPQGFAPEVAALLAGAGALRRRRRVLPGRRPV